jgi:hypothetical protein
MGVKQITPHQFDTTLVLQGAHYYLGSFSTINEAAKAYDLVVKEMSDKLLNYRKCIYIYAHTL